jgi:hypothetical protein
MMGFVFRMYRVWISTMAHTVLTEDFPQSLQMTEINSHCILLNPFKFIDVTIMKTHLFLCNIYAVGAQSTLQQLSVYSYRKGQFFWY